jgi:hypothetical protein
MGDRGTSQKKGKFKYEGTSHDTTAEDEVHAVQVDE